MTNFKTFESSNLETSISDFETHCCTEPFNWLLTCAVGLAGNTKISICFVTYARPGVTQIRFRVVFVISYELKTKGAKLID